MTVSQFKQIDRLFRIIGEYASLLNIVLVFMILIDVIARYFFFTSEAWLTELEWHIFALIFLFGVVYTLQYDDHVRVDVWYTNMPLRRQLWINLIGTIIFLIPWCLIIIITSTKYAHHSWEMSEMSADPGGLAYRYVIKYAITVAFVLLLIYAVFFAVKCAVRMTNPKIDLFLKKHRN